MQNNNCKNNSHCRKLLSGIPTSFSNTQGGDPRQKHSGMTLKKQVILNLIQDLQRLPLSFLNNLRGRCQIKFGMTFLFSNSGFTLIELLVVVLIIGILAAVAVPQYQKAVYKSRAVEAVTILKAITEAQEIYYLANGEYTDDISKLDVNVPENLVTTAGKPLFEDNYSYTCSRKLECFAIAKNNNLPDFQFNFRTGRTDQNAGKFYCNLGSGNSKTNMAKSICQSMGRLDESRTQAWAIGKYFIIN